MTDGRPRARSRSGAPAARPTPDQIERFAKLSPEQRFHWLVDMLRLCHELSPPEVRAKWREHGE